MNECEFLKTSEALKIHFSTLVDPRVDRTKSYSIPEIMLIILSASICGAESWRDFVRFGDAKIDFLRNYFPYKSGIPCKNTFARIMSALDPEEFKVCFMSWVNSFQSEHGDVIAIDGKTLRNSATHSKNMQNIVMVSAFSSSLKLVLAQEKVSEKSNEITAIPLLLDLIDVENNIITLDAMGCQTKIAEKIISKNGDYIFSLKGNQGSLNEDIRLFLESEVAKVKDSQIEGIHETIDAGHGRIEVRKCFVSSQIEWLTQKEAWAGLQSVAMIEETQIRNGKTSIERRFFISSLPANAQKIAQSVRAHWTIENCLHWTLDVVFNEDLSTIRSNHSPQNMAVVRHFSLNMLQMAKQNCFPKNSIKGLRKSAGWDHQVLSAILKQNFQDR
jgi:predicted transposase YbfD/YdcC